MTEPVDPIEHVLIEAVSACVDLGHDTVERSGVRACRPCSATWRAAVRRGVDGDDAVRTLRRLAWELSP